jgi:hypothetical protein
MAEKVMGGAFWRIDPKRPQGWRFGKTTFEIITWFFRGLFAG